MIMKFVKNIGIQMYFQIRIVVVIYISSMDMMSSCGLISRLLPRTDPEAKMNVTEIIRYHHYPVIGHDVITKDGYILSVQEIPHGKNNTDMTIKRKLVLILHGIFEASIDYVANTPDKNLAYILAEENYSVWLGNFRGNLYGRRHVKLNPESDEFWQFSFDEIVEYDLPAMIDYVLNKTGFEQLQIIGHSLGTTTMFALLSSTSEYNKKIQSFHALAPAAEIGNTESPLFVLPRTFNNEFVHLLELVGGYEMMPHSPFIDFITKYTCLPGIITTKICAYPFFAIMGYDDKQFNYSRSAVFKHSLPLGASTRTYHHLLQMSKINRFQHYDFGDEENLKRYNQSVPPLYEMTKIAVPIALYWGKGDIIAVPKDVAILRSRLNHTLALDYCVPFKDFNHLDFLWALEVVPLLYEKVIETMKKFWKD